MIELVVSGGQSGVDLAGWRAAKALGIPTSGFMTRNFRTEDGPRPEYAELYNAVALDTDEYPVRTKRNAEAASVTLWFGAADSRGHQCTRRCCREAGKPFMVIPDGTRPSEVADHIRRNHPGTKSLNIAGSRASSDPELGERVERWLIGLLRNLNAGSAR